MGLVVNSNILAIISLFFEDKKQTPGKISSLQPFLSNVVNIQVLT